MVAGGCKRPHRPRRPLPATSAVLVMTNYLDLPALAPEGAVSALRDSVLDTIYTHLASFCGAPFLCPVFVAVSVSPFTSCSLV